MRFSRLEISYFRNLTSVAVELSPGLNYFHGENGAGKTAVLEAVHLLCRGRSFRTQRARSLIQHDADQLVVRAVIDDEFRGLKTLAIAKDRRSRTELKVDGKPERRLSEVARVTPLQVMLPDIAELVFGGPANRRSWIDWGTFHVKPDYLGILRDYLKAVKQRNVLIRDAAPSRELQPWTEKLVELAQRVTVARMDYLAELQPHFESALARLAPELAVQAVYYRGWSLDETLEKVLGDSLSREVKYGATQWGPHRADVQLRLQGAPASTMLSRGQGKMVASALQIAQAMLLAERDQRRTVFLIDDAGAELDTGHNVRFFELLREVGGQILATTTQEPGSDHSIARLFAQQIGETWGDDQTPETQVFHVEHGVIRTSVKENE